MNERVERTKKPPDWDTVYTTVNLDRIPWNSDKADQELTQLIDSKKIVPRHALDVGCGTGTDAIYLAAKGAEVTAIDISQRAIAFAREKAVKAGVMVNFMVGDFLETEFENETFDFVNDRGFFHIINPSRREEFAAKVSRILKSQGFYYLRCWSDKQEFEGESTPYRISRDIIQHTFSKFFDIGEIRDIRWGGRGPWSYVCLMRKKV
jgi:ubiquinone/menaquinone biosynthesis C-methylase UbiE